MGDKYIDRCVEKLLRAEASRYNMYLVKNADMHFQPATCLIQLVLLT